VACYVDTSALVKLVVAERETDALRAWFAAADRSPITSDLTRTELMRAVRRTAPEYATQAREVLDAITLVEVTTAVFEAAGRLDPAVLRSLDAIHLAAALDLGDEITEFVTYDDRLADGARAHGLVAVAPS
jgi:uncharacterized protein